MSVTLNFLANAIDTPRTLLHYERASKGHDMQPNNLLPNWRRWGSTKTGASSFLDWFTRTGLVLSLAGFALTIALQYWHAP